MRKKMKRVIGILLSLALVLGLMPGMSMTAHADDYYLVNGIFVNSVDVTKTPTGVGWSYDAETHTLTLDNYTFNGVGNAPPGDSTVIMCYPMNITFTIELKGTNTITQGNSENRTWWGIYSRSDLVITGSGTLNVSTRDGGVRGAAIYGEKNVAIESGTVYATSGTVTGDQQGYGIGGDGNYALTIKENANVTLTGPKGGTNNTVKNYVAGTGWTNTTGTEGNEKIEISTTGQTLNSFKKVKFLAQATVKTAPTAKTLTYNGKEQELVTAGTAENGTMKYAIGTDATTAPTDGWSESIPTGTNAVTYYVWYKVVGDDTHSDTVPAYVTVTIARSKSSADITTKETIKYSGEAQELVTPGEVEHGTMMYALGSDDKNAPAESEFKQEIPKGTEPKTYYVWYYAKGDEGYESTTPVCIIVQIIEVKADTDIDESMLPQGKETSVDTNIKIPIPSGLAKEAQSLSNTDEKVELKLIVAPKGEEKATESETLKDDAQMSNSVKSQYKDESTVSVEVLEIDIEKYINNNPDPDKISQTNEVIEIAIPYNFNGKFDARVVRKHNGETHVFTPLSGIATGELKDGTFYADTTNNVLYIYSNKFSTYVVAYSTVEGNAQMIVESSGSSSSQINYPKTVPVYRLYNTKKGAHLLTASKAEHDLLLGEQAAEGWTDEGIAFETAVTSGIPVYRVFDMKSGIHFYTSDVAARDTYVSNGCSDEGIGWYATANAGRKVYKVTNPKNGFILYTTSKAETDALANAGFTCVDAEFTVF